MRYKIDKPTLIVNTSLDDVSVGLDLGANLTLPEGPIEDSIVII